MSVLSSTTVSPATAAANQIVTLAQQQFVQLARSGIMGYNAIWRNPNASPADVLAALGTNAAVLFALAQLNIQTIASAASIGGATAPAIPSVPANFTLTFNSDGSANLSAVTGS